MTKFILLALLVSVTSFAAEEEVVNPYTTKESVDQPISTDVLADRPQQGDSSLLSTDIRDVPRRFNHRSSHWLVNFGFEGMKYDVPWTFTGEQEQFRPSQHELWGGRLGFGGAIYLGGGLNTTTRVEGFYVGTLFSKVMNAGPQDEAEEFAYIKRTGNMYGVEVSQSLGWMFDLKTKNPFMDEWTFLVVEPFIEAGVGRAWAYNRISYDYNTGATTDEGYKESISDDLMNAKFGGGVNFTANSGYFFYMKVFVNNFDIIERKTTRYERPDQQSGSTDTSTDKSVKIDPITTYAIGGGYKF